MGVHFRIMTTPKHTQASKKKTTRPAGKRPKQMVSAETTNGAVLVAPHPAPDPTGKVPVPKESLSSDEIQRLRKKKRAARKRTAENASDRAVDIGRETSREAPRPRA